MPYLTPDAGDGTTVVRVLVIPKQLLSIVNGALEELTKIWNFEQKGTELPSSVVDEFVAMLDCYYSQECTMSIFAPDWEFIFWNDMVIAAGNTFTFANTPSQEFSALWFQNAAAQNDYVYRNMLLVQGQYDFVLHCQTQATAGIAHLMIDDVDMGTVDLYNNTTQGNQNKTISAHVDVSGFHKVGIKIATKNASSTGYVCAVTYIKINRTGD